MHMPGSLGKLIYDYIKDNYMMDYLQLEKLNLNQNKMLKP